MLLFYQILCRTSLIANIRIYVEINQTNWNQSANSQNHVEYIVTIDCGDIYIIYIWLADSNNIREW